MSSAGDLFTIVKKLFLVSENMSRLSGEVQDLSKAVQQHGERLVRIETMIEMSTKPSRRTLPAK